jgi:hypothetical protein
MSAWTGGEKATDSERGCQMPAVQLTSSRATSNRVGVGVGRFGLKGRGPKRGTQPALFPAVVLHCPPPGWGRSYFSRGVRCEALKRNPQRPQVARNGAMTKNNRRLSRVHHIDPDMIGFAGLTAPCARPLSPDTVKISMLHPSPRMSP